MRESLPIASVNRIVGLAREGIEFAEWYDRAVHEIRSICVLEGWNAGEFIDILAITSPRVSVRRNVRIALHLRGTGELFNNVLPNIRVSLSNYATRGVITGPKTGPFARALRGDKMAIVLDVWMAKALLIGESKPSVAHFTRKATRDTAERRMLLAAEKIGLCVRDTQAAVWAGSFREAGQTPQFFPLWDEYKNWLEHDKLFPSTGAIETRV